MHKVHIRRSDLIAIRLDIQYYDEPPYQLDLTTEVIEQTRPGYAIIPWVWVADDSRFHGERLQTSGWHLPLRINRHQISDALDVIDRSISFTYIDNIQVLEVREDSSILIRTYSSVNGKWEIANEFEVILEF